VANEINIEDLTQSAFLPFGDVLQTDGSSSVLINQGYCVRYSDIARLQAMGEGKLGLSIFVAKPYTLPLKLEMVERHPEGSQAFLPTTPQPFIVLVAEDVDGKPAKPRAFMTAPGQGVNYYPGIWHGVLTPLVESQFFVIDRIGNGKNLEEHWFEQPYIVQQYFSSS
jgi:ureidoglycolate lyase